MLCSSSSAAPDHTRAKAASLQAAKVGAEPDNPSYCAAPKQLLTPHNSSFSSFFCSLNSCSLSHCEVEVSHHRLILEGS